MRKIATVSAMGICLTVLIIAGLPRYSNATTIYACVGKGDLGLVRIVSGPGQCSRLETSTSWDSEGPQGPVGPQGPAGVANGITTGVHGVILYNGTIEDGVGFSSAYAGTGIYYITFTQAFSFPGPHCVVSAFQSPPTSICSVFGYGPTTLYVNCGTNQGYADTSFSFICVQ